MAATSCAPCTLLHVPLHVYIPTCSRTRTHSLSPLTHVCVHKYIDQHFSMLLLTMEVLPSVSGEGTGRCAFHSTLLTMAAEAHTRGFVQVICHDPLHLLEPPASGRGREPGFHLEPVVRARCDSLRLSHLNKFPWVALCGFPME